MSPADSDGYDLESVPDAAPPRGGPHSPPASSSALRTSAPAPHNTFGEVGYELRLARQAAAAKAARKDARVVYTTPLVMLGVGLAGVSSIIAITQGGSALVPYLLGFAGSVPIGLGVYLLCCACWIGFNDPIHLIALNLAGVYAVTDFVWVVAAFVPLGLFFPWLIATAVYVGLLAQRLEIDLSEAIIVGLLTFLAKVFIAYAIVGALS